ncbi:MAG: SDR family oxidoreductase [Chitinophagales bacterium]|nr:SDR family oxidoreductase [Chitinophagales bacterium]
MQKANPKKKIRRAQNQERPGLEYKMDPKPVSDTPRPGSGKLAGKVALITGGDSGIGRAVALLFAKEGADIALSYLNEEEDALETKNVIEKQYNRTCLLLSYDISKEINCVQVVQKTAGKFGRIDVLVNNAGMHYERESLGEINSPEMIQTFATNVFSIFWITRQALIHMKNGGAIINTASVTAYRGSSTLIDYASTKGAIVSFTRSLSANLIEKGIRVNGVAPGPIWTPLIVSSFDSKKVSEFGSDVPMKRAGQPSEIAPCYLFFACDDSAYITGQFLHPNGGEIVNG